MLPEVHIYIQKDKRPKEFPALVRMYYRKWIIHPVKRRIAKYYLVFLRKFCGLKVVGITGSAGKTTTKEMVGSILKNVGPTVISYANIDPVYNIPTTILKCTPGTKFLILEMGIEFPGEMDYYLWLAKPDISICTSVYWTHTLFFGSIDGVEKEKSKIVKLLNKNSFAVLNADDPRVKKMAKKTKAKVIFYNLPKEINYTSDFATKFDLTFADKILTIKLPMLGKQFVSNSLAAANTAFLLGASQESIKDGLENLPTTPQRMVVKKIKNNSILIDDSYNANPSAVKATLDVFNEIAKGKTKIFIFGEMKELGQKEKELHQEIGKYVANKKIDCVIGIGDLVNYTFTYANKFGISKDKLFLAKTNDEILDILKKIRKADMAILVKGSRSMKLEEVVTKIK